MDKSAALEQIRQRILQELECPLKDAATNLVFGKGNPEAAILFIGEAPGAKEDELGVPFVGAAGKELDALMHLIGLSLDDAYVANILKYRPPKNRDPSSEEIRCHTPYLVEQIKVICPRVLVTLGNFATKFVLGGCSVEKMKSVSGITALHGKHMPLSVDGWSGIVMPLFHPAAMLYRPQLRTVLQKDFLSLKEMLGQQTL
ncbi:uracil-DNA glycosylase [Candidatus Woesearchaeota archaeon]|nr:uracil-DNA glycosylase [Candidatus Woesearchaeota archaeon]